jgi:Gpi18-like mannosyltransferase
MTKAQIAIAQFKDKIDRDHYLFPAAMWFTSRLFIWTAMLLIAPKLPAPLNGMQPKVSWGVFDVWDCVHYRDIATSGYEFVDDGQQHNLAFFPLFPLIIRLLMSLGLPFEFSGILVNNLAFLAALCFLYAWLKKHYGISSAQWGTTFLSWCPMSMFTGVIYTEGLYLFLSTAALYAFDQKHYKWTAICGALATATRPTGMVLIPAFILAAFKERRPVIAYIAALATSGGLILFSLFCLVDFKNPLAFIAAQKGWRPSLGFDWQGWLNMLLIIPLDRNWYYGWVSKDGGGIKDPLHPILFVLIVAFTVLLWLGLKRNNTWIFYGAYCLIVLIFIMEDEWLIYNLLNVLMFLGGGYLLWYLRKQLTPVNIIYGFLGIGLLLASGGTISLGRLAYGIVPLDIAIGVLLSQYPRQGYLALGLFVVLLAKMAIGFAQYIWVG